MNPLSTHAAPVRGFSLIEVLIAILILALGLLGLGAVIPVVVKQQRSSADATLGVAVANAAQNYLLSRPEFTPTAFDPTANPPLANVWNDWLEDTTNLWGGGPNPNNSTFLWNTMSPAYRPGDLDLSTGDMTFKNASSTPATTVILKLADRLWPGGSTQPTQTVGEGLDPYRPMFVWDFVGRRVKVDPTILPPPPPGLQLHNPAKIQIALFVRRIDANIPVPRLTTNTKKLFDMLTESRPKYSPVAVEGPNDPTPTNRGSSTTGSVYYGNIQKLTATFDLQQRDRITLTTSINPTLLDLAARPDQKLVDNLGNVYTVREIIEDPNQPAATIVRVTPSVPPSVGDPSAAPANSEKFEEVIFTPQIPASVRVFTIVRPSN